LFDTIAPKPILETICNDFTLENILRRENHKYPLISFLVPSEHRTTLKEINIIVGSKDSMLEKYRGGASGNVSPIHLQDITQVCSFASRTYIFHDAHFYPDALALVSS
jgi:hypothetical protein